jgi:hypothetical protein
VCGRAHVLLSDGKVDRAVAEAKKALTLLPEADDLRAAEVMVNVAGLFARAENRVAASPGRNDLSLVKAAGYQRRAVALVHQALRRLPAERRKAFWRRHVAADPALQRLRSSDGMLQLAQSYDR